MPAGALGLILIAVGVFSVAGGFSNWSWWWNNRRARLVSALITQTGARGFYVLMGGVMIVSGVLFALGIVEPPKR